MRFSLAAQRATILTRSASEGGITRPRRRHGSALFLIAAAALACGLAAAVAADDKSAAGKPSAPPASAKPAASAAAPPTKPAEKLPPLKGSHIKDDDNSCFQCHTNADLWDVKDKERYRFFISSDALKKDVHYRNGVNCSDCHGGDPAVLEPTSHQAKNNFLFQKAELIAKRCAYCHAAQWDAIRADSVHVNADKTDPAHPTTLTCDKCHGQLAHSLLPVQDPNSPVYLGNQVKTCGGCHEVHEKSFLASVHGKGLTKLGLDVGPVCANCHGAHGIYRKLDARSALNIANVADTCGKCHRGIRERLLESVHGTGGVLGGTAPVPAPGGTTRQLPSCTSCHVGHEILAPEEVAFREALPSRCGNCHSAMSTSYALSIHGQLTALGYGPAAKCSDCHGSHDILPPDNPRSMLSAANRPATCGQCHGRVRGNFVNFNPHIDPYNRAKFPVVYGVQMTLLTLLFTTFAFFGLHCLLWFIRGVVEFLRHSRPRGLRPGETAYVRFVSFHRIGHTIMMGSFLGLAATGLPLKYHDMPWAKSLARFLGGFESTGFWHRFFGVILLVCLAVYVTRLVRLLIQGRRKGHSLGGLIFGPDSPVPNLRDLKDFLKMMRWFFGLGPKPGLERWSYWEKVDFWGAIADTVIIGSTGLMLWFPTVFCLVLPGKALNIAMVIHSTQALLATGFVFAIHFFNAHLRPDKFPGDMSVLTGLVSEEEFKDERPDYFDRLRREGKLEAMRTTSPGWFTLISIRLFGLIALAIGLALLAGMILAALGT